jgi:hypothetical protein
MIFYLTNATLEIVGGASWWILSKTTNIITSKIWKTKEAEVQEQIHQLSEEIKKQRELLVELTNLLKKDHDAT